MKNIKKIYILLFLFMGLTYCNKKDKNAELEEKQLKLMLEKKGEWWVDLFEIDGGDSTKQHFPQYDENYKNCVVVFKPEKNKIGSNYAMEMELVAGRYSFSADKTQLIFHDASNNCPSATIYKPGKIHNIFVQIPHGDTPWTIETLTSDNFVLSCDYKRKYLVKLIRRQIGTE